MKIKYNLYMSVKLVIQDWVEFELLCVPITRFKHKLHIEAKVTSRGLILICVFGGWKH